MRGVDAFAAQQRPDLADLGTAIRGGQDPALLVTGELSPFSEAATSGSGAGGARGECGAYIDTVI